MGNGLAGPALWALLSREGDPQEQGVLMGVGSSLSSLARVGGPILAGAAFDRAGMSSPYWMGAAFMVVGFFLIRAAAADQPRAQAQT